MTFFFFSPKCTELNLETELVYYRLSLGTLTASSALRILRFELYCA